MTPGIRAMTGRERTFPGDELIVSKTDDRGRLTYVNDIFLSVSGYRETEVIGQPHNIVRHPDTPRCLFKLMWDTIGQGREIFVYVNNLAKNGDHYWVFAHVTPDLDDSGKIVGFHSNRRVPRREVIAELQPLYDRLTNIERSNADGGQGLAASSQLLGEFLAAKGKSYAEFVLSL
ncbi:PAS domain-containing protein [Telmatospirillum sp.]|uniref:PAS domain-containing protein n=1 Tax=Telmatospirillum sp. TaxID=2079197 RepID=UPI002849D12C|nr:PAS domain-containing protein [Telmatospirillum sp.]MDR3439415.1 PAS domain-containing protein [Telmatospirillum sp.]